MHELTLGEHLTYLIPSFVEQRDRVVPAWPPDVFALTASLLVRSGTYCKVLTDWPPDEMKFKREAPEAWTDHARSVGLEWRRAWSSDSPVPSEVSRLWTAMWRFAADPLKTLEQNTKLWQTVLKLMAYADEASCGVGSDPKYASEEDQDFIAWANSLLFTHPLGATLCDQICPSRLRVLPKIHTPQTGLTIRSLSHNLALCSSSEVIPEWRCVAEEFETSLTLLVIPWPLNVVPRQFHEAQPNPREMYNMPRRFGFFTFEHAEDENLIEIVEELHADAERQIGKVDVVILPEMAVSDAESWELGAKVRELGSFLVCGCGSSAADKKPGTNRALIDFHRKDHPVLGELQAKHHRWKLDRSQLKQYGLASQLYTERDWWEYIPLDERKLIFTSLGNQLVLSVLICEDLARPDPVADLVRSVGPNLIVSLLMDGPQLRDRWPSRYATVLADDPGCSVLSVTSLGMSKLSRASNGHGRPRVVALWKDARSGVPEELELPQGADGLVLSLAMRPDEEWTADGRVDRRRAVFPTLSGVRTVSRSRK